MSERSRLGGTVTKALMPMVASVASALGAYAAKKGSRYLEETVLPKLRDSTPRPSQPEERPRTINDDLERRRRERAEHRAARREAS